MAFGSEVWEHSEGSELWGFIWLICHVQGIVYYSREAVIGITWRTDEGIRRLLLSLSLSHTHTHLKRAGLTCLVDIQTSLLLSFLARAACAFVSGLVDRAHMRGEASRAHHPVAVSAEIRRACGPVGAKIDDHASQVVWVTAVPRAS